MLTAANNQMCFCQDYLGFTQQHPVTSDCLQFSDEAHFHFHGFMNKQNMNLRKSTQNCEGIISSCKMHLVVHNQQTRT